MTFLKEYKDKLFYELFFTLGNGVPEPLHYHINSNIRKNIGY